MVKQGSCGCLEESSLGRSLVRFSKHGVLMGAWDSEGFRSELFDEQWPGFAGDVWSCGFSHRSNGLSLRGGNDSISSR